MVSTANVILNVRNLFDEVYVQDATDNSRYNAVPFRVNNHKANAAEVFLGMPTSYNLGIKINFWPIAVKFLSGWAVIDNRPTHSHPIHKLFIHFFEILKTI